MIPPSNPERVSGHAPWTYVPTDPAYPEYGGELISGDGKCVAMVGDPATGAQILAAVNAHDDLVAALRLAVQFGNFPARVSDEVNAALAKAVQS